MNYGLSTKQIDKIKSILKKYKEVEQVIIFGSRAINTFKKASNIDLAIKGKNITLQTVLNLKDDFEESYLPFLFDVVDYNVINNKKIKRTYQY